jgi:hypothetical protein
LDKLNNNIILDAIDEMKESGSKSLVWATLTPKPALFFLYCTTILSSLWLYENLIW